MLNETLKEEAALYEALMGIFVEKRQALIGLKTRELELAVAKEEAILSRLADAGAARARAAKHEAERLGLRGDATLREIAAKSKSAELSAARETLARLMKDVARANDLNRALAEQSLDHSRQFLRALAGVEEPSVYTKRGGETAVKNAPVNLFDSVA